MRERIKYHVQSNAKFLGNRKKLLQGKGVRARCNGLNPESAIPFHNFCECPRDFGDYWTLPFLKKLKM